MSGQEKDRKSRDNDAARPDRATDPQREGRREERERLQEAARPRGKRKVPERPQ